MFSKLSVQSRLILLILFFLTVGTLPILLNAVQTRTPPASKASGEQTIAKILFDPGEILTVPNAYKIELSALAYDANNQPIWSGVSYTWGISSTNSVGTLVQHADNDKLATFKSSQNVGYADIYVRAINTLGQATTSIPVFVGITPSPTPTGTPSPTPSPTIAPTPTPVPNPIPDTPVQKSVFLLIFNPILENYDNVKLTQFKNWYDPDTLTSQLLTSLNQVSHGYITYSIKERQEVDGIFPKPDGYQYTDATYLACVAGTGPCHSPDIIDYQQLYTTYNICAKNVDEVWMWGGPYFGYWEFALAPYCGKTTFTMGFNYERTIAEALHDFGHRMEHVGNYRVGTGNWQQDEANEWNKYSLINGHCGNIHYPPGTIIGQEEYKYNKSTPVSTDCDGYLSYPTGPFTPVSLTCTAWGCTQEGYVRWWLTRIPSNTGTKQAVNKVIYNNWWKYYAYYDETTQPIITPTLSPGPSTSPTPTPTPTPFVPTFSNLSGTLEKTQALFSFSYSGFSSNYIVDLSTVSTMTTDVYVNFAQGSTSPIAELNPIKWDKYTCGRTLYFRMWNAFRTVSSTIQSAVVTCPTPTSTPTPSYTPTPTAPPTTSPTPSFTPTPTNTTAPVACNSADIDKNNVVDLSDLALLKIDFLSPLATSPRTDINKDGVVDLTDYSFFVLEFGKTTVGCL